MYVAESNSHSDPVRTVDEERPGALLKNYIDCISVCRGAERKLALDCYISRQSENLE